MKNQLNSLWFKEIYLSEINNLYIAEILNTPFLLEIVVKVLPKMISNEKSSNKIKQKIITNFPLNGEKIWKYIITTNSVQNPKKTILEYFLDLDDLTEIEKDC